MIPVTASDLLHAVHGTLLGDAPENLSVERVCYDTRELKEGDFFLPLQGSNFDGHSFIDQAFDLGAVGCFTMRPREEYRPGKVYIKVPDTARVPRLLAQWYRSRFTIPFVAVTGSVGKTTTKNMVAAVLSEKFSVHKTPLNHNNALGVPMALLDLDKSHQISVIEMGMNHAGEIDDLSDLVRPQVGIITNIGDAHIENLGSREGILKAKCELFAHMAPNAPAVLNGDDELLGALKDTLDRPVITCGVSPHNEYYVTDLDRDLLTDDLHCVLHTPNATFPVVIPAVGDYMVYPVLTAAAVAEHFGMTAQEIARGILRYAPTKMRMNVVDRGHQVRILDDAYNANPQSMRAALQTLASTQREYKMAILGDMFELGPMGPSLHSAVGRVAGELNINCLVAIGALSKHMAEAADAAQVPEVYWFATKEEALSAIAKLVKPNAAILVKASRGMKFEDVVSYLVSITPEKEPAASQETAGG